MSCFVTANGYSMQIVALKNLLSNLNSLQEGTGGPDPTVPMLLGSRWNRLEEAEPTAPTRLGSGRGSARFGACAEAASGSSLGACGPELFRIRALALG